MEYSFLYCQVYNNPHKKDGSKIIFNYTYLLSKCALVTKKHGILKKILKYTKKKLCNN